MEEKKVPALRFRGFDNAWEQRKVKELCNIGTGKSNTQDQVEDGIYPFYIRSDIPVKSNKYLYDCEAVITIGDGNIGRVFHYVNGKFDLHQRCYKMRDFQDILGKYFYYFFSTRFYDRAMKMTAKATVDSVRLEMISEMDIWKPIQRDEQKKIAKFFTNLDHLISLHQRKLEMLKKVKKSMLEKMFPKNDAKVPEVRFSDFTDAWEQRKVKELCNIGTGKSNTQDQVEDGIYPFYIRSDIPVKSNKYLYDCEAVITIGDGNIGRVFHYVNGKFDLHQRCYKMRDFQDILGKYFYYFFSTRFYDRAMKMTAKATVDSVRLEMISEMDIWKPIQRDEQKKIAKFFTNLDHLISLHQRKLEMLKKVKKSMLEKMFPKNDAKVPEVRFSDFTDAWEQRRLGELADKVTEKNTLLAKTEVLTNSAEFGIINQREFFDHDIVNENNIGGYYIVRERDFVYNPRISVSAPVGPINCNKLGKSGVMSPLYTVFRVHDIDSVYLEYFFKTSRWHSFMRFNGDSGVRSDRFSIKTELFYKMPIPITKYCEQVKIGKHFSKLDHLISLHQRKYFSIVMLNTIIQIIEIICLCCFSLFYGVDYNCELPIT